MHRGNLFVDNRIPFLPVYLGTKPLRQQRRKRAVCESKSKSCIKAVATTKMSNEEMNHYCGSCCPCHTTIKFELPTIGERHLHKNFFPEHVIYRGPKSTEVNSKLHSVRASNWRATSGQMKIGSPLLCLLSNAAVLYLPRPVASFYGNLISYPALRNCNSLVIKATMPDFSPVSVPTLQHYSSRADAFWQGTKDHDVTQNRDALIRNLKNSFQDTARYDILDLGCGPGRDIQAFLENGHKVTGRNGELICLFFES